ncbi:hypothetical protein B484DRAFT_407662 [Ochromonadaceae sp. CCMP2298]|nr:hypothetical protein B484DRAFT_407662 [Ochromonadaceae sp. CCMP2298]
MRETGMGPMGRDTILFKEAKSYSSTEEYDETESSALDSMDNSSLSTMRPSPTGSQRAAFMQGAQFSEAERSQQRNPTNPYGRPPYAAPPWPPISVRHPSPGAGPYHVVRAPPLENIATNGLLRSHLPQIFFSQPGSTHTMGLFRPEARLVLQRLLMRMNRLMTLRIVGAGGRPYTQGPLLLEKPRLQRLASKLSLLRRPERASLVSPHLAKVQRSGLLWPGQMLLRLPSWRLRVHMLLMLPSGRLRVQLLLMLPSWRLCVQLLLMLPSWRLRVQLLLMLPSWRLRRLLLVLLLLPLRLRLLLLLLVLPPLLLLLPLLLLPLLPLLLLPLLLHLRLLLPQPLLLLQSLRPPCHRLQRPR